MNGNSDPNYSETGNTGAYSGAPSGAPSGAQSGAAQSGSGAESVGSSYAGASASGSYDTASGSYTAGGPAYTGPAGDPYATGSVPPPPPGYVPPYGYAVPPPVPPGSPNPGLAALLGFIPGVGAMYNGQFPKGIAHIVIFAILTSLANHVNEIFGLLVAGWIFYMVFDAYQTARARRDGLVVPDPFGLNNIGERFGMPLNPNWGDFVARPAAAQGSADTARTSNPYAGPAVDPVTGAPTSGYTYVADPVTGAASYGYAQGQAGSPYATVPPAPYPPGTMPPPWHPDYPEAMRRQAAADMGGAPASSYQSTYAPQGFPSPGYPPFDPAAMPPLAPQSASGIPTGAIWLIGLGVLALTGSLAHNFYWRGHLFGAAFCFIIGAVLLVQQTSVTRKLYPAGTAAYRWSLLHQARAGLTLLLVGVLQTIAATHITSWHFLWPYLLIFFGLLQVADRSLYNRMLVEPPVFPGSGVPPVTSASGAAAGAASAATPQEEVR